MLAEISNAIDIAYKGKNLREKAFRLAKDVYNLKDGAYFRVDKNGEILSHIIVNKNSEKGKEYEWFRERDFYSKLVTMNKPVDKLKKIHSNNMYTIFVKAENLPDFLDKKITYESFDDNIDVYFSKLLAEPEKKEKEIFEANNIELIDKEICTKASQSLKQAIRNVVNEIKTWDKSEGFSQKGYVKVFIQTSENLEEDLENYKREGERYLASKVFNDNNYNVNVDDTLYGLSGENMGLNAKKIYLEMKTTKFKVPYRVTLEEAMVNYYIMQWIENYKVISDKTDKEVKLTQFKIPYMSEDNVIDPNNNDCEEGFSFETMPNKSGDFIKDINYIPKNIEKLSKVFKLEDYVGLNKNKLNTAVFGKDKNKKDFTESRLDLETYIDRVFFKNQITFLYYNDKYKIKGVSRAIESIMGIMKDPMKSFFRLGNDNTLNNYIDIMTFRIVHNLFLDESYSDYAIKEAFNLRLNLLNYFNIGGKKDMGNKILDLREEIKAKLNDKNGMLENDDQYYYCIGQIVYYLISLSEADKIYHSTYNSILIAKSDRFLRDNVFKLYHKYNHKIQDDREKESTIKFNKLYEMICGYTLDNPKIDYQNLESILTGGIISENLITDKK